MNSPSALILTRDCVCYCTNATWLLCSVFFKNIPISCKTLNTFHIFNNPKALTNPAFMFWGKYEA